MATARLTYLGCTGRDEPEFPVGTVFELVDGGALAIGRGPSADIRLPPGRIARLHAVVAVVKGLRPAAVCDLLSTNGTWVRGERITGAMLYPGEELSCAEVFRFRFDRDEEDRAFPPG